MVEILARRLPRLIDARVAWMSAESFDFVLLTIVTRGFSGAGLPESRAVSSVGHYALG